MTSAPESVADLLEAYGLPHCGGCAHRDPAALPSGVSFCDALLVWRRRSEGAACPRYTERTPQWEDDPTAGPASASK